MKLISAACLALLGIAACNSCSGSSSATGGSMPTSPPTTTVTIPLPSATVEPVPTDTLVVRENWTFTLPKEWLLNKEECTPAHCAVSFRNQDDTKQVVFVRESTQDSMDAFVITTLRSFKGVDAEILSTESVSLNSQNFVLIKASRNSMVVDTWVTVIDDNSYALACGGAADNTALCKAVAESLMIN